MFWCIFYLIVTCVSGLRSDGCQVFELSIFYLAIVFLVLSCQYICSWSSVRNILLPINIAFSHVAFFLLTSSWCYLQVSMCHASCIIFVWSFVQEMYDYTHIPGQAVLHRGRHRHGARAISSGLRINLLLWCRRYTGISPYICVCVHIYTHTHTHVLLLNKFSVTTTVRDYWTPFYWTWFSNFWSVRSVIWLLGVEWTLHLGCRIVITAARLMNSILLNII